MADLDPRWEPRTETRCVTVEYLNELYDEIATLRARVRELESPSIHYLREAA